MMKNHHLAKAIADAGWAEFMRQCEYKAKHEGRIFAKIGTFFRLFWTFGEMRVPRAAGPSTETN